MAKRANTAKAAVEVKAASEKANDPRPNPSEIVKDMTSKSSAIRALAAAGYTTAEIAKADLPVLKYEDGRQIRYQHVRNVLTQQIASVGESEEKSAA